MTRKRSPSGGAGTGAATHDPPPDPDAVPDLLLRWYDRHARSLPWRAPPGSTAADPYAVWLSEIMLQQTTVAAVIPYFRGFLERWPDVAALAAADRDEVLAAWAGLGYYSRARNLHLCAQEVAGRHGGRFPDDEAGLLALPGIGPYTAAAIAAIAFDRPAVVVDGNVERVVARLFAEGDPLPAVKPRLRARAAELTPRRRPGDFAQAMMDLGATICTPRGPDCLLCPLSGQCRARAAGIAAELPRRAAKAAKPQRHGIAFWLRRPSDGAVLLERRPPKGLLGGMLGLPGTPWEERRPWPLAEAMAWQPAAADWLLLPGGIRHVFTHFALDLSVALADLPADEAALAASPPAGSLWLRPGPETWAQLPTVMRKAARFAETAGGLPAKQGMGLRQGPG